ncbi:uncharacterized protein [Apostichopus japonicus]|uniref:uncharacterized protein n=1 Tax=Stichopus japonicus TaxID=307972 RepID=UPI003AB207FA
MSHQEHRKCLTGLVKDVDEEDMLVYLYGCAKQKQWLKWESAMQVDTSWKKLLYIWTPELLSFHINAIHDQLPSPANLKMWAFRTADGTTYRNPVLPLPKTEPTNILKKANDWIFLMDEEHKQIVFPPEITETAKRPDITIFSKKTKNVIIIELTVPMEENLANAYARKKCKYQDLVADCESRGWSTYYFPIEVGSRGFCNTSVNKCLASLGIP